MDARARALSQVQSVKSRRNNRSASVFPNTDDIIARDCVEQILQQDLIPLLGRRDETQ